MSGSSEQAQRLQAEARQATQAAPGVIATHYRLQPADLPHGKLLFTVEAVSLQGIETLSPVAHSQLLPKPLVLDAEAIHTLSLLAGSPLIESWVGTAVEVYVADAGGNPVLRLRAPAPTAAVPHHPPGPSLAQRSLGPLAAILLLVLLLALVVYVVDYGPLLIYNLRQALPWLAR